MRTITFDQKNSWEDYGVLTLTISCPEPEVKIAKVEIPGRDGDLDMTEAVAGHPVYNNRPLEFLFRAVSDDTTASKDKRNELVEDIHGKVINVSVDDEDYSYRGRASVTTETDAGYYVDFMVSVDAEPFKKGTAQEATSSVTTTETAVDLTNNGDSWETPTVTTNGDITMKIGTTTVVHSGGTFTAPFSLEPHETTSVIVSSEDATTVTFTWTEGHIV